MHVLERVHKRLRRPAPAGVEGLAAADVGAGATAGGEVGPLRDIALLYPARNSGPISRPFV